jgi:hypothetical protein
MGTLIKFENGDELRWLASPALGCEENDADQYVIYKERTGANTATVQRGDYQFEVFLDELEEPELLDNLATQKEL